MLLLDTNAAIALLGRRSPSLRLSFDRARAMGSVIALSSIVSFELWYGAVRSQRQSESSRALSRFLSGLEILPFDAEDAATAAEIRAHLRTEGTPIGPYDLLIAAQALRRGATLITANLGEFRRVPGLQCLDWQIS